MRRALCLIVLVAAGCATTPREEPAAAPEVANAPEPQPAPALPPRPIVPEYATGPVLEWARAPAPQAAPEPVAAQPGKATQFDESPALPRPEGRGLGTTGYHPLDGEKPFFDELPGQFFSKAAVRTMDAGVGDPVSWFGVIRGIETDAAARRTRLLLEAKYFDGMTDTHILCLDFNGGGDFVATLDGADHPVKPLALVRVYGKVTAVKEGLPRVKAEYVRQWDWGGYTFMFAMGKQKGSEEWRKLNTVPVTNRAMYDPYPKRSYYEKRLGSRDAFSPGKVAVPAD